MSCDYQQLPHPGIQTLQPYIPGKSIEELAKEQSITSIIKLASNENPLGCSPKVNEAIRQLSMIQLSTYPAPTLHPLKHKLSHLLQIDENMLVLGNGSDTLFTLLLTLFGLHTNKCMLTHDKAFISYEIQSKTLGIPCGISPVKPKWEVDITEMIRSCSTNTGILFIANPNNPTGLIIPLARIKQLLESIPSSTIVVIDEAYYEYAYSNNEQSALSLLKQFPNLVITRTFSKAYGLAGLRIGYAIAHPPIIELIQRIQLPFTVNQVALAAAFVALDDNDFLAETIELNTFGKQQLQQGLNSLDLITLPSHGNFITVDCGTTSLPIYQHLLQKGIIVRPLTPYGLPNHLRITIGNLEQNTCFLDTLSSILTLIRN